MLSLASYWLVSGLPRVPASSPRTYGVLQPRNFAEANQHYTVVGKFMSDYIIHKADAHSEAERTKAAKVLSKAVWPKLRAARLACAPGDNRFDIYPSLNLEELWPEVQVALAKRDVEKVLDYVALVSNQTCTDGLEVYDLSPYSSQIDQVRQQMEAMDHLQKRKTLNQLNILMQNHVSAVHKILTIKNRICSPAYRSPRFPGETGRHKAVDIAEMMVDRWAYFVESGQVPELLEESKQYWRHRPTGLGPRFQACFLMRLKPSEMLVSSILHNSDSFPEGSCSFHTRNYNQHRLFWESWRISLALQLFLSEQQRLPKSLQELVQYKYLTDLPMDPYCLRNLQSGSAALAPLGYDGKKVWSVGWDGLDQQGQRLPRNGEGLPYNNQPCDSILDKGDIVLWESGQ